MAEEAERERRRAEELERRRRGQARRERVPKRHEFMLGKADDFARYQGPAGLTEFMEREGCGFSDQRWDGAHPITVTPPKTFSVNGPVSRRRAFDATLAAAARFTNTR